MSALGNENALEHVRCPQRKDWKRVVTMPCIMTMKLPRTEGRYNAAFISFGLEQKPNGGVEFVYSAAFNKQGRWKGWNWKWIMLQSDQKWWERLIFITDAENQFVFEGSLRYFRFLPIAGQMTEKLITDAWQPVKTFEDTVGDWLFVAPGYFEDNVETVEEEAVEKTVEDNVETKRTMVMTKRETPSGHYYVW